MNKRMVGDVFIVVIDEIGECTFARDPMHPAVVELSKKETVARCFAAVLEMLDVCSTIVPTSKAQFYIQGALELCLANQAYLIERLTEQVEFNRSIDEAAEKGGLLENSLYVKRFK